MHNRLKAATIQHSHSSDWLVYHDGGAADLLAIAAQTAIYVALMAAAGLFDLYRKRI